jgi:O-antigen ligase
MRVSVNERQLDTEYLVPPGEDEPARHHLKADNLVQIIWLVLIWGIVATPVLETLAQPNSAHSPLGREGTALIQQPGGVSFIISQVTNLAVFVAILGAIAIAFLHSRRLGRGLMIWLGVMALSAGMFLGALFGLEPSVTASVLRLPLLLTAVFLLPPLSIEWFARQCKRAIAAFVYITLAALAVVPHWVLDIEYQQGLVPGLSIRYHGFGLHSNSFALLLLTYLILDWLDPARGTLARLTRVVIIVSLLMTQSKTVLMIAALVYFIRFFYIKGIVRFLAPYLALVGLTLLLLALTFLHPAWDRNLASVLLDEDQVTLTGRTDIWDYTIEVWSANPIFGYGQGLWHDNLEFALRYHWSPGQAHNQLFQTLGESGLVGVTGLLIFCVILAYYSLRNARSTEGVSLAFFVVLLGRSVTEAPLRGALSIELFSVLVAYTVLVLAEVRSTGPVSLHADKRYSGSAEYTTDDQVTRIPACTSAAHSTYVNN